MKIKFKLWEQILTTQTNNYGEMGHPSVSPGLLCALKMENRAIMGRGTTQRQVGLSITLNGQYQPRSMTDQFANIYTVSAWVSTNFQIRPWMDFQRSPMELHGFHCLLAQNVKETFFLWSCQQLKWSAVWLFFYVLPLNAYVLKNIMSVYIFLFSFWWLVQAFSCNCKASAMNTTKDLLEYDVSDRETFVVSNMPTYVLQNLPSQWKEPLHKIKNSSYTDKNGGFHFPPHFLASHSSIQDDEWVLLSLLYQALAHCIEENGQLSPNKYTQKNRLHEQKTQLKSPRTHADLRWS